MRIPKALWQAALMALVMTNAGASLAQATTDPAEAEAPDTANVAADPAAAAAHPTDAKKQPTRPFIERSLVIAPERVGKFNLYSMKDFPDSPGAGIAVRYQHEDFPSVRVDVFIYPVGRQGRREVLASGMDEVRRSLETASEQGKYSDVSVDGTTDFDLRQVEEDGSLRVAADPPPAADRGPDDAGMPRALSEAKDAVAYQKGLRMSARLTIQDEPQNSLAFLFYRGLYLVKGRISASPTLLPDEAFDRFANHAMASLVPLLTTRSTGGCHQFDVVLAKQDMGSEATVAGVLAAASETRAQEACAATLDETLPAGHRAMPLVYTPEMWD